MGKSGRLLEACWPTVGWAPDSTRLRRLRPTLDRTSNRVLMHRHIAL